MTTRPLTPESEALMDDLYRDGLAEPVRWVYGDDDLRTRLAAIEAAAIARYAEGLVEVVARRLRIGRGVPAGWSWDRLSDESREPWLAFARRLLGVDAPEAKAGEDGS